MAVFNTAGATKPRDDLLGAYHEIDYKGQGFIADILFPDRMMTKRTGTYGVIPREVYLQHHETQRAPDAPSSTSRFKPESDTLNVLEYSHKIFCPSVHSEEYEDWFDLEEEATMICRRVIEIDKERDAAALVINETNFPASGDTGVTLTHEWDDGANSTPVDTIEEAKEKIVKNFGVHANALVLPYSAQRALSRHPDVIAQIVTPGRGGADIPMTISEAKLAEIFGIDRVIVARPVYNSASPGATPSVSYIWNEDYAFLTRISTDPLSPSLGWNIRPTAHPGVEIKSWEEEDPEGTYVKCAEHRQQKLAYDAVGFLIKNIKTA